MPDTEAHFDRTHWVKHDPLADCTFEVPESVARVMSRNELGIPAGVPATDQQVNEAMRALGYGPVYRQTYQRLH